MVANDILIFTLWWIPVAVAFVVCIVAVGLLQNILVVARNIDANVHTIWTVGKQIADLSTRRQIGCAPHAWLSDLLKAASLHLNAYLMDALYLEYNVSSASLLNNLCTTHLELVDGHITVPDGPGLGVEIDERVVEQFRVG